MEALTKQNGVRLFGKLKKKFKKKVKTDLPYLSFYKKKPESYIFFFWPKLKLEALFSHAFEVKLQSGNRVPLIPHSLTVLSPISTQENFPQKENFVKCDWPTQIFRRKKILKLKNFRLLTMIFSENFLSVENFS